MASPMIFKNLILKILLRPLISQNLANSFFQVGHLIPPPSLVLYVFFANGGFKIITPRSGKFLNPFENKNKYIKLLFQIYFKISFIENHIFR